MLQLAIRGHATRGREVIQLLEMLGGVNDFNFNGTMGNYYYYINDNSNRIYQCLSINNETVIVYTLEEFEEKFPYKVGDIVKCHNIWKGIIESMEWYEGEVLYHVRDYSNDYLASETVEYLQLLKEETIEEIKSIDLNKLEQQLDEALAKETPESLNKWMNEEMKKGSKLINIEPKLVGNECVHFPIPPNMKLEVKDGMCYLYRDCGEYKENKCLQELKEYLDNATPEQLEEDWKELEKFSEVGPVADEYVEQCKENVKGGKATITYKICDDGMELIIPFNEEIVYDKCRWILRKKQPQYPKTYEECCQHLGCDDKLNVGELIPFQQLVNARNAYWKIAGKGMGLDKPWKPDWDNLSTTHEFIKINKGCFTYSSRVLVFPTPEMRDAFLENFEDLIKECKELL